MIKKTFCLKKRCHCKTKIFLNRKNQDLLNEEFN